MIERAVERVEHDVGIEAFAEFAAVRAQAVPRQTWEQLFKSQGMKHPEPRIRMLDGFNQGWIEFGQNETMRRKGRIGLREVLTGLAGVE